MTTDTRRLTILSAEEISALYDLPKFNDDDRRLYFYFSSVERDAVDRVHTSSAAVHLALQLAYFKAKRRFFVFEPNSVADDIAHVVKRHFTGKKISTLKAVSKPTRLDQQKIILQLFDYRLADQSYKEELEHKSLRFAMLSTQPIYIMREVLQHLESCANERLCHINQHWRPER